MQFSVLAIVAAAVSFVAAVPSPQAGCTSSLCATIETGFTAPQPVVLGEFVECCAGTTCTTTTSETFQIAGFTVELAIGVRTYRIATSHELTLHEDLWRRLSVATSSPTVHMA